MKHKTIIRLLIKLLGVFFLLNGVAGLLGAVTYFLVVLDDYSAVGESFYLAYPLSAAVGSGAALVAGLVMLLASNWLANALIPSNRPYCPNCGYELTGMRGNDCPECGVQLPQRHKQEIIAADQRPDTLPM
ncbi:MAG: hypothetical protein KTR15_01690 [Phycisphaeraceae bacterium]|nr:hypothetical protein [Phycisphaeraceae bacterium]